MKRQLVFISLCLLCQCLFAQHLILLRDGSRIEQVRLHEIKNQMLVYEQYHSLHDLLISRVQQIQTETQVIEFTEEGGPIYFNMQTNESATTPEIARPIERGDPVSIVFKDQRKEKEVIFYDMKPYAITYQQAGSLHDVFKHQIDVLTADSTLLYFDSDGHPIYENRFPAAEGAQVLANQAEVDSSANLPEGEGMPVLESPISEEEGEPVWEDSVRFTSDGRRIDLGRTDHTSIFFWTPLALIDPMNTVLGGIEMRTGKHVSLLSEIGYVFGSWTTMGERWQFTQYGVAVHSAVRLYGKKARHLLLVVGRMYVEGELVYKIAHFDHHRLESISDLGFNVTVGSQRVKTNGRVIETYLGFGSHSYRENWRAENGSRNSHGINVPVIHLGVKIGLAK
ncbi:MAG: hypothetical protein AAF587_11495 [Bacteroidota bacterium]